jgi:hypothetical protein
MDRMTITHDLAVTAFEAFGANLDDVWALGLTRGVTINGHQLAAIIQVTDPNEADEDGLDFDGNPWRTTVTIEETRQGVRDADIGLWLHVDGTWATFPESADGAMLLPAPESQALDRLEEALGQGRR